jgi:hypothetical protein
MRRPSAGQLALVLVALLGLYVLARPTGAAPSAPATPERAWWDTPEFRRGAAENARQRELDRLADSLHERIDAVERRQGYP